jgi:hypothetical protein
MAAEEGETDVGDIAKLVESDQNHALVIGVGVWTLAAGKPIQVAWHDESSDLPAQPSQRVTLEIMCGVGGVFVAEADILAVLGLKLTDVDEGGRAETVERTPTTQRAR